jgi:hypothetical protein
LVISFLILFQMQLLCLITTMNEIYEVDL